MINDGAAAQPSKSRFKVGPRPQQEGALRSYPRALNLPHLKEGLELVPGFARAIEPLAHFLAGFKVRHAFLLDGDVDTGARIGAYAGLTTRRYASGETDWTGRISKCGDKMLRSYLYEAANVPLTRVAKWSALTAWGVRIAKRSGLRKAKVAVARKLAVILHRMRIDGAEFKWSSKEAADQPA